MRREVVPLAQALLLAALAADVVAQPTVAVSHGVEHLSNGSPDWHETTISVRQGLQPGPRGAAVALALTRTSRFGLHDNQAGISLSGPVTPALVATLEASGSDTHRVLAESAFGTTLQYEFAKAWLLHGGIRTTRYDAVRVNQALLMLEHYTGPYSWAVGWRRANAFGTEVDSGELRGTYYYGERHSVGVIVAAGREATSLAGLVTLTSQRSAVLVGRHWLRQNLAITYSAGHTREGDFYNRNGFSLGLQSVF